MGRGSRASPAIAGEYRPFLAAFQRRSVNLFTPVRRHLSYTKCDETNEWGDLIYRCTMRAELVPYSLLLAVAAFGFGLLLTLAIG